VTGKVTTGTKKKIDYFILNQIKILKVFFLLSRSVVEGKDGSERKEKNER
jgi:hypothetical protein